MATIIRHIDSSHGPHLAAMKFDDLAAEARRRLAEAKLEAERIVAEAQQQADAIRQEAAQRGAQAAVRAVEQMAAEQLAPASDALRPAVGQLHGSKQAWLAHWESSAVRLASAMASRIVRGELRRRPEITLTWVREALELAAGSPGIRLRLHPEDFHCLGEKVRALVEAMAPLAGAEVAADATVSRGGCRVETRFGSIDQQLETQLKRIEEELIG